MDQKKFSSQSHLSLSAILFVYTVFLAVFTAASILFEQDYEYYYILLQEDGILEWASFWGFFLAAVIFGRDGYRHFRKQGLVKAWFGWGLALFCFVVAMEEISWGQRLLGYQPPTYFLEKNYQQEFNFHNIVDTGYRKIMMKVIILGYGVAMPIMALIPSLRRLMSRFGIFASSLYMAPLFVGLFFLFQLYPFKFTGEIVELLLGMGFIYSALSVYGLKSKGTSSSQSNLRNVVIATGTILILSALGYFTSKNLYQNDPLKVEVAKKEVTALQYDLAHLYTGQYGNKVPTCGKHMRLYTYFEGYKDIKDIATAEFQSLQAQGLTEERAEFIIDPWNMPYWVKDICTKDGRRFFSVYSFGPDRIRQSTDEGIKGDDVGLYNIIDSEKK